MKTKQVVPGVYSLADGFVYAYLVEDDDGLVMVDTGTVKLQQQFAAALSTLGKQADQIRRILVTHHHPDHAGSLAELVRRTGATVWVHATDAQVVRGDRAWQLPEPSNVVVKLIGKLMRMGAERAEPADVDNELTGGEHLEFAGGIDVVETPGHTAGHVSYLLRREGGVLFAGDAAVNVVGGPAAGPPFLSSLVTERPEAVGASLRRIAAQEFEVAVFGHGSPIVGGAAEQFRRRFGVDAG
jgi:glyoxylase-like metal-dependent hydrolase (beta-lactamase superfamily II)